MTFFRLTLPILTLLAGLAVGTPPAAAHDKPKGRSPQPSATLDSALQEAIDEGASRVRVIIRVEPASRKKVKSTLERQRDHILVREHPVISALTMEVPVRALPGIVRRAGVVSVSVDGPVTVDSAGVSAEAGIPGTLLRATLGLTDTTLTGTGVGVAVIDSGIDPSADFAWRIRAFYDFTKRVHFRSAYDDHGHGTHVAGLIGGNGYRSNGLYAGVAPQVSLIGMKVLGADGSGYTSDVIAAIEFAITYKAVLAIDIINLSLGHPPYESANTDPLVLAVERAAAAGIIVLTSAGNVGINSETGLPGYGGITSPGNARSAITVGAAHTLGTIGRTDDLIEPYSSRGPTRFDYRAKPDVIAPGHKLIAPAALNSTLADTYPSWLVSTSTIGAPRYMRLTGTSMATAVTSGVVALMLQANRAATPLGTVRPRLTPNAIKAILQFTALPMRDESSAEYSRLVQGAGGVNAAGAIALAAAVDTAAPPGQPWIVSSVEPYTEIDGAILPWAQFVLWGDMVLWGDTVYRNSAAWSQFVLWGDMVLWGDHVVQSEMLIWGDNIVWAEDILVWGDEIWDHILIWGDAVIDGIVETVGGLIPAY